jgi:hypothetical protein
LNGPPLPDDTKRRVDAKIDTLMEKLAVLSKQVDTAAERLTREDAARVRRAFQEKEGEGRA